MGALEESAQADQMISRSRGFSHCSKSLKRASMLYFVLCAVHGLLNVMKGIKYGHRARADTSGVVMLAAIEIR